MRTRIHIFGASGCGTTSLGRELASRHGLVLFDADDFFWLTTDPPYQSPREYSDRQRLLTEALSRVHRWVLTGSLCGWGDVVIRELELAVFVLTDTGIRLSRLRARERSRFGDRVDAPGDMYKQHTDFLEWAAQYDDGPVEMRSRRLHEGWLAKLRCPVLRVDGSKALNELCDQITEAMVA